MLGARSCSFLSSNARVEQDKDRGSPVLVQCRWFESPVPDKGDETEKSKVNKVRHSVHFGEARICDQPSENNEIKTTPIYTIEEGEQINPIDKGEEESKKEDKPKKQSIYSSSNSIPIIKVAKVTNLNKSYGENAAAPHKVVPGLNRSGITIKVYAKCLAPDIEYKTVIVGENMSSRELIWLLLSKYRMKHRDPKLFYLTMDVTVRKTGIPIKRTMVLEDDARPAQLRSCNPWGECKFSLQMRKGGLVRVYDSVLVEELKYKCLLISEETTVEDVIRILLNCYGLDKLEEISRFCLFEIGEIRERKLNRNEKPLAVQSHWSSNSHYQKFVLRRATRSVSNQFPEETCVDDNDKLYWGYSSNDSSSSTCSEIENAFHPIKSASSRIKTAISNPSTLDSFSTPTAFSSALPLSALLSLSRPTATSLSSPSLFPSLPTYSESPVSPLSMAGESISYLVKQSSLRIIKGPSFGSVSSDNHSEESEHFFYI